ncbi:phosphate system positive regulatory protein pho81 [Malassezia yamatoensis]|uniref:Phosphate system positive regulatory protein pho81 n=1 Tax=Malassezia yamatoensis TaxID=253288 RepID=A0AAJ5YSC2_9BASI|nr:phosphate system positive regulatory protein pho81 [Malassezia yamatoensis]
MSDLAAGSVLQLESLAEGHELPASSSKNEYAILGNAIPYAATNLPSTVFVQAADTPTGTDALVFDSERRMDFDAERNANTNQVFLSEISEQITAAVHQARTDDVRELTANARKQTSGALSSDEAASSADRSEAAGPVVSGLEHQVWRALATASVSAIHAAIVADLPAYDFVDDINARTTLHISTLAGQIELVKACVEHGVSVRSCDVYGREALAYAAMQGQQEICQYLLSLPAARDSSDTANNTSIVDAVDLDGFSPLVHAVVGGHTSTVRILLDFKAAMGSKPRPKTEASDLSPLALAAQGGSVDITRLLLERGATIEPNTEGLLPLTLAARAGHLECMRVLLAAKVDVDPIEKGSLWTPLFYAAEAGHLECVRLLLDNGASSDHVDEKGRHAVFYAAWNGWMQCVNLLLTRSNAAPNSMSQTADVKRSAPLVLAPSPEANLDMDLDGEVDGIPSLYLPPPIIPFRTYGHNYLDKRSLLSISLTNKSIVLYKRSGLDRFEPFLGQTSSVKLVMTPRTTDTTSTEIAIPHTIVLPMADDREEVTFQVANLDQFQLEWELFPPLGSSRIAKTAILADKVQNLTNRATVRLALFDWCLNVVGHVDVAMECVKPFGSVQLEIGGRVETYWKSTLPSHNQAIPAANSPNERRSTGLGSESAHVSRSAAPLRTDLIPKQDSSPGGESSYVTASSLSGDYLRVKVQYTSDMVPVVCSTSRLPLPVWAPLISQVTKDEFLSIAEQLGRVWDVSPDKTYSRSEWSAKVQDALIPLHTLLSTVPLSIGLTLEVQMDAQPSVQKRLSVNECVDATLHAVYEAADRNREQSRKLFFSSAAPDVCVALNWKQPNSVAILDPATDPRQSSIREGVSFAKGNNLLGVMADADLLDHVPELISSIRAASLLLITLSKPRNEVLASQSQKNALNMSDSSLASAYDGYVDDSVIRCTN